MSLPFTQSLTKHMAKHIGTPAYVIHELTPSNPHIDIHVITPTPERPIFTLITSGMSEFPMDIVEEFAPDATPFIELMLALPATWNVQALDDPRWNWPFLWLRLLAAFPRQFNSWLWVNHTIPNGDPPNPFGPRTQLCCWFIRTPLTVPSQFSEFQWRNRNISILAATAIYEKEMQFALSDEPGSLYELDRALGLAQITEVVAETRPAVF